MATFRFLQSPPRYFFFTGKGGVGQTSMACATALYLTDQSERVLLESTDPASDIGQVFGQETGNRFIAVASVPGLADVAIDPQEAANQYHERILVHPLLSRPERRAR